MDGRASAPDDPTRASVMESVPTGGAGFLVLDRVPGRPGVLVAEAARWWRASPRAFGGQLVAHCIVAAGSVSPFKHAHSVHVHFINVRHAHLYPPCASPLSNSVPDLRYPLNPPCASLLIRL